ncbi:MAG: tetratricopeptide repeat protein [Anaerolineae bacterium]|nr:tetratricopeptide repeat protein [Anaerolineae bacterium]MCB0213936.1 tetratricopeptide repeat protein [Anaerolineae bacterium]
MSIEPTAEKLTQYYTIATEALGEIAQSYYRLGRLGEARHLLRTVLPLIEAGEARPQDRLKLLLPYGQVLVVDHLLARRQEEAELMISTLLQAKQIAEAGPDQRALAEALCWLGQAHYFAAVVSGALVDSPSGGKYDEALGYQQQALQLREALHDTRGMSESLFCIGTIYERRQQPEQAQDYYRQARQVAQEYNHVAEQAEPARHFAVHALWAGDLDQALTEALLALSYREAAPFKPYLPFDHLLLRDIYLKKGDTAQAQFHTQQASALAEEMGYPALVASMPNLGDL